MLDSQTRTVKVRTVPPPVVERKPLPTLAGPRPRAGGPSILMVGIRCFHRQRKQSCPWHCEQLLHCTCPLAPRTSRGRQCTPRGDHRYHHHHRSCLDCWCRIEQSEMRRGGRRMGQGGPSLTQKLMLLCGRRADVGAAGLTAAAAAAVVVVAAAAAAAAVDAAADADADADVAPSERAAALCGCTSSLRARAFVCVCVCRACARGGGATRV
jgi:hypothetical protein